MNERFRELYYESSDFVRSNYPEGTQTVLEKFAELIIRECINVVYDNVEVALDANGKVVVPDQLLKDHFGIE